jgi:hypothetical protein
MFKKKILIFNQNLNSSVFWINFKKIVDKFLNNFEVDKNFLNPIKDENLKIQIEKNDFCNFVNSFGKIT